MTDDTYTSGKQRLKRQFQEIELPKHVMSEAELDTLINKIIEDGDVKVQIPSLESLNEDDRDSLLQRLRSVDSPIVSSGHTGGGGGGGNLPNQCMRPCPRCQYSCRSSLDSTGISHAGPHHCLNGHSW